MPNWNAFPTVGSLMLGILLMTAPAKAQIAGDGTLGTQVNGSLAAPCTGRCIITNGATRGSNLFHSFYQFSLPNGDLAAFVTNPAIQNVIVRVTGVGQPFVSNINGTIATFDATTGNLAARNFFLLNPNGIVFSANARVLTGGSFLATTADRMIFQDGTEFRTTDPAPLLTINVPIGLGFTGVPKDITLQGSRLSASSKDSFRDFALVGGNIALNNTQVDLQAGRVELTGVGSAGVVGLNVGTSTLSLNVPDSLTRADVSLINGFIINLGKAEDITINARNLEFSAEKVLTNTSTPARGNISLNATDAITLRRESVLAAFSGGNILIQTGSLYVMEGSGLLINYLGQGNSGNIIINAHDRVAFDGEANDGSPSFVSVLNRSSGDNPGTIQISTRSLSLTNGAFLQNVSVGQGNSGDITINARDAISLDGEATNGNPSRISSEVGFNTVGNGGNIHLTTGSLTATNGASINTSLLGQGHGGNITIDARDAVTFDGSGSIRVIDGKSGSPSSGVNSTVTLVGDGNGGNIQITAGRLSVTNGAEVDASTLNRGNAGSITINARDRVTVDGSRDGFFSAIDSAVTKSAIGNGGGIRITTKTLAVTNGGHVSATTSGQGNGGNIIINATDQMIVSGRGSNGAYSSIQSAVNAGVSNGVPFQAIGKGGDIKIFTESLLLNRGFLTTSSISPLGEAGNIEIGANRLQLDNNATITTTTALGNGGNIALTVKDLVLLRRNSIISATAGSIGAGQGTGDGGNILINTPFLVSAPQENSDIKANAFSGSGGRVTINATGIYWFIPRSRADLERLLGTTDPTQLDPKLLPTNDITAISQANPTLNGQVTLNTLDLDPNRGLTQLPTNLVDRSTLIAQNCKPGSQQFASTFVVTGRGGLPTNPIDPLVQQSALTSWVTLPGSETATDNQAPKASATTFPSPTAPLPSTSEIVEARGWTVDGNGNTWLVATAPTGMPPNLTRLPPGCSLPSSTNALSNGN